MRSPLLRRRGAFSITVTLLEDEPEAIRTALCGCVVVRAESMWHNGCIEYLALHEDFDEVPQGRMATAYACDLFKHADGTVTRTWRKT